MAFFFPLPCLFLVPFLCLAPLFLCISSSLCSASLAQRSKCEIKMHECRLCTGTWVLAEQKHIAGSVVSAGYLFVQVEPWEPNGPRENDYITIITLHMSTAANTQGHYHTSGLILFQSPSSVLFSSGLIHSNWFALSNPFLLSRLEFNLLMLPVAFFNDFDGPDKEHWYVLKSIEDQTEGEF